MARLSLLELPALALASALVVVLVVVVSLPEADAAVDDVAAEESATVPAGLLLALEPALLVALALLAALLLVLPPEDAEDPCPLQPASSAASAKALKKNSGERRPAERCLHVIGVVPRPLRQRAARCAQQTLD